MSYVFDDTLRIKVENVCNLCCNFCHAEGNYNADRMTENQIRIIADFARINGFTRIHFTGGEPTLHPQIANFIEIIKRTGLNCGITTNGQFQLKLLSDLKSAGLDNINFSIPTIDTNAWIQIQAHCNSERARQQIDRLISCITQAQNQGLTTKLNILVGLDSKVALQVIDYFAYKGFDLRLLDILGCKESIISVGDVLLHYNAVLLDTVVTLGTSQVKYLYDSLVGRLVVKSIRDFTLPAVCNGCPTQCYEKFYGIRIESVGSTLFARTCIHRSDEGVVKELSTFTKSEQFIAIRREGTRMEWS